MTFGAHDQLRIAVLGNFAPRRCGIATFTEDLYNSLAALPKTAPFVVAMNDEPLETPPYPAAVRWTIRETDRAGYRDAGLRMDRSADVLLIQHEFGIFGGEAGEYLLDLLRAATIPAVTTLHTVLADPNPAQERVMRVLIARSRMLVVMAERGKDILRARYGVPADRIAVIPHGVPDRELIAPREMRRKLGWPAVPTLLSFGLLSPGKGLETMIDALPALVREIPDLRYVILGATHPHIVRRDGGETYRETLAARARALGVGDSIAFINRFVRLPELCDCLQASDIYVTPYLSEAQITSGTLAYAHGLGVPVVSTPYWHAAELLGHRPQQLVPFGCPESLALRIGVLLRSGRLRRAAALDAYARGRSHVWSRVAAQYAARLRTAAATPLRLPYITQPAHRDLPATQSNAA